MTFDEIMENLTVQERDVIDEYLSTERYEAYQEGYSYGLDYGYESGYDSGLAAASDYNE